MEKWKKKICKPHCTFDIIRDDFSWKLLYPILFFVRRKTKFSGCPIFLRAWKKTIGTIDKIVKFMLFPFNARLSLFRYPSSNFQFKMLVAYAFKSIGGKLKQRWRWGIFFRAFSKMFECERGKIKSSFKGSQTRKDCKWCGRGRLDRLDKTNIFPIARRLQSNRSSFSSKVT